MLETVTSWLDANWFPLLAAVFLLGMMLYGHSCGFLRLAVSFTALLVTMALVRIALPCAMIFAGPDLKTRTVLGILLFFVISVLLRVLIHVLDIFTKLPVVHGLNQIFGALLGLAEALILLWLGFLVLGVFETTETGRVIRESIDRVLWLKILYDINPVGMLVRGFLLSTL